MISLNLIASGTEQTLIKDYLEQNASEMLAEKINNGVIIEKDGKKLLNVKTLTGFMAYAAEEAGKLAEKGAKCACIEDTVVFGWAIHYFEEESIEGTLYLEDGTEYKPTPKVVPRKMETPKVETKKKAPELDNGQQSMFDLFSIDIVPPAPEEDVEDAANLEEQPTEVLEENAEETVEDTVEAVVDEKPLSPLYTEYMSYQSELGENTLILMRVGDFYEIFGEWAKKAAQHLELTLVGRDLGLPERTPMVGIPFHRLEVYVPKIQEFAAVAVCDKTQPAKFYPKIAIDYSNVDKSTGEVLEVKLRPEQEELLPLIRNILKEDLEVAL